MVERNGCVVYLSNYTHLRRENQLFIGIKKHITNFHIMGMLWKFILWVLINLYSQSLTFSFKKYKNPDL